MKLKEKKKQQLSGNLRFLLSTVRQLKNSIFTDYYPGTVMRISHVTVKLPWSIYIFIGNWPVWLFEEFTLLFNFFFFAQWCSLCKSPKSHSSVTEREAQWSEMNSCLSQGYLCESECDRIGGTWTLLLDSTSVLITIMLPACPQVNYQVVISYLRFWLWMCYCSMVT